MVACQRESIGDCAPLSSKALPRGVARATLHSSRIVWMLSPGGARGVEKAELNETVDSDNNHGGLLKDICITSG